MDSAFSLIKNKEISAKSAEYRQNLDEQMVCPACYEPVFKKQLWVASKNDKTHFFSHYAGDQESCPERTSGEGGFENSKDKFAQLQRLEIFNKFFREHILCALKKIIGIQSFNRLESALEFSERICVEKLNINELLKLERDLIGFLDQPLSSSIDNSLGDLEDAVLPIYWHFKSNYGESNLRFITCIALLMTFYKENQHLENILEKKTLKNKRKLSPLIAGNAILLLANSEYVAWSGSTKPISNFIASLDNYDDKTLPVKKNNKVKEIKKYSGYFSCPSCKKRWWLDSHKNYECYYCKNNFYAEPISEVDQDADSIESPSISAKEETASNVEPQKTWRYCINCKKQYYSVLKSDCPHDEIKALEARKKEDETRVNKLQHCSKCTANYLGTKTNNCPYCNKKSSKGLRTCDSCNRFLISSALLPSKAGAKWRKCNFCNLNFEV